MKHSWLFVLLLLSPVVFTGCEMIGDIFKAGVWVGVVLVMLVIGITGWLVTRSKAWKKASPRRLINLLCGIVSVVDPFGGEILMVVAASD
jgi:hypothetical protein